MSPHGQEAARGRFILSPLVSVLILTKHLFSALNESVYCAERLIVMNKTIILICTLTITTTGCHNSAPTKPIPTTSIRSDTVSGMIQYLEHQKLPALKSVQPWQNPYGPGLKLTTGHYEIYTTLLEPLMLSQVPGFVESAYRGYNSQLPEPLETGTKFTTYLFADRDQWDDFTIDFAGRFAPVYLKIKAGAYYLNGACVAYNIGRERTFSVIGHEGWHQFTSRLFRYRLPSWLDEGIAMLFETSRYDGGLFYFEPGQNSYRLGGLKKTLAEGRIIPLARLIAINPGEVLTKNHGEGVTAFYSQAYVLVRFLREDDYGKRLRNYHRMLLGGVHGTWLLDKNDRRIAVDRNLPRTVPWNRKIGLMLFKHYIGDDLKKIENEYIAFCRKTTYPVKIK